MDQNLQSDLIQKFKSFNWNRWVDVLVVLYLGKLLVDGYLGQFNAFGKGAELEELLRVIFVTASFITTLGYLLFGVIKKAFLFASILAFSALPILLFGLLYYGLASTTEKYSYQSIYNTFLQFTVLQTWLGLHGLTQLKNNKRLQIAMIVFLIWFLI